jgi:PTS system nitrogen regulatory IIA component
MAVSVAATQHLPRFHPTEGLCKPPASIVRFIIHAAVKRDSRSIGAEGAPYCPSTLMNRLAAILPAANVLVDVDATSKKRAFEHAGLVFENQHAIARATVTDNLFARERLGSTGLGHGVAIPHGRIKGLKNPLAAVLRVQQPIPFDAPDDEPVSLLIFLLVPEAATQRHLEILSEIAEMLSDRELRERLKTEGDAQAVHRLIADWEPLKSVA